MTFVDFLAYYKKNGRCPQDGHLRKNPYTDKQLITRYKHYVQRHPEGKTPDQEFREKIVARDSCCQLYNKLTYEGLYRVNKQLSYETNKLDVAHIFPKSTYPKLRYDTNNAVLLTRMFHNRLDEQNDPVTGKPISKEKTNEWWEFIIGSEHYKQLLEKVNEG